MSIPSDRWGLTNSSLRLRFGISTRSMAFASDVPRDPSVLGVAGATVIPEVGVALVSPTIVGLHQSELKQISGVIVRLIWRKHPGAHGPPSPRTKGPSTTVSSRDALLDRMDAPDV